jgi:intraflagellar transport protein 81
MEKISFIVDALNHPPFEKGISTMTELDGKTGGELLGLVCEIVVAIDSDQEGIFKEPFDFRISRIMGFLTVMKFHIPEDQMEDFQNLLYSGDKDIIYTIMHWCLSKFEHLSKRAYLAKFLVPLDIPAEFKKDDLEVDLSKRLKELQTEFKEVHKAAEQVRASGVKPSDLKQEIIQLENDRTQLQNKIQKMKKDMSVDDDRLQEMLRATSALRKEQENEVMHHERLREHRRASQETEMRFTDANRRYQELKSSGIQSQSAQQILTKLSHDVKELQERRDAMERVIAEREMHLEKLQSWDNADRPATDDDVQYKRDQVHELEDTVASLTERLDVAVERNTKLVVSRQASAMAMRKLREKEDEVESLQEEARRLERQIEEKEADIRQRQQQEMQGGGSGRISKAELKKYGQTVKDKIDAYKRMREELAAMRGELVILQRTESILRGRDANLEQFLTELEKQKGVEGYRETQRALIEMTEKTAEIDQMKGATLEDISAMVESINREFKNKQQQLQPLIGELKGVRQEYLEVESQYQEKKLSYEKVAVGLDMEKQSLEKDCTQFQDECLREESRYHQLQNMISLSKIRLARVDQEKEWQSGHGRLMRDFASLKELYTNKLAQQEQLTKQLRKRQKELKENAGALTNQKTNFMTLHALLDAKARSHRGGSLFASSAGDEKNDDMLVGGGAEREVAKRSAGYDSKYDYDDGY